MTNLRRQSNFFPTWLFRNGTSGAESGGYLLENVLRVHPAALELRSSSGQYAQQSFTALVDERDFVQIHDAGPSRISAVVLLPARSELMYPGVRKPAMKNPSFFRSCFTEIDLQHAISSRTCCGFLLSPWPNSPLFS